MNDLCGKYPVTLDSSTVGTVTVSQHGLFYHFECLCQLIPAEPLRLFCYTGSHFSPVGIPAPSEGSLRLLKKFSKSDLERLKINEISSFMLAKNEESLTFDDADRAAETEDKTAEPAVETGEGQDSVLPSDIETTERPEAKTIWQSAPEPHKLFSNAQISSACFGCRGCLKTQIGDETRLAVPISPNEPFPMMSFFLYGKSENIDGRDFIVFSIKNGNLI